MKKERAIWVVFIIGPLLSNIYAQDYHLQWQKIVGADGWDIPGEMIRETTSTYYMTFNQIGNYNISLPGNRLIKHEACVVKMDTTGNVLWKNSLVGKTGTLVQSIALVNKNVIVAGFYKDTLKCENKIICSKSSNDVFIASFDQKGKLQWLKSIGGDAHFGPNVKISADTANSFFILGTSFHGHIESMSFNFTSSGKADILLIKFLTDGEVFSGVSFKNEGEEILKDLISTSNKIYVAGNFNNKFAFKNEEIQSNGKEDAFLICLDNHFEPLWIKNWGSYKVDQTDAVAVFSNKAVFVTGSFESSFVFGDNLVKSNGESDVYVACLDTSGKVQWVNSFGGKGVDRVYDIAVNDQMDVFISGSYTQDCKFSFNSNNQKDLKSECSLANAVVVNYNRSGHFQSSFSISGLSEVTCNSILALDNNNLVITGSFRNSMTLSSATEEAAPVKISAVGDHDVFIAKYTDRCKKFGVQLSKDTCISENKCLLLDGGADFTKYLWTPGNSNERKLNIDKPGQYKLTINNKWGCQATDSIMVYACPTLTKDYLTRKILLNPNPTNGMITLSSDDQDFRFNQIEVQSPQGQILQQYQNLDTNPFIVDLGSLPPGQYFVRMMGSQITQVKLVTKL